MDVKHTYVALHRQAWVPIFVRDRFDAVFLADVCVEAGLSVIEITCRRPGVVEEIRRIKAQHSDLLLLVGSTVDSDEMVRFARRRGGDLPRLEELADLGVDGFVAQFPFSDATLERYRRTHVLIPGVECGAEAYHLVSAGAHFAKIHCAPVLGGPDFIRAITASPTHGLLPIFVTGGMTTESVHDYIEAGAALPGGGWDAMLRPEYEELQDQPKKAMLLKRLVAHVTAARAAREEFHPALASVASGTDEEYLTAVPHYHPFLGDELR